MDEKDLPYRAEYAESGRASCRSCKSPIAKGTLRLAVMVQSPKPDVKTPLWYHYMCFFSKQRPKSVDDIAHYESLRWEDQQFIKNKIESSSSVVVPGKKGKKRNAEAANAKKMALQDFKIEYSKSSRATCRGCEQKIMKEEIRISKKDFETEVGKKYGGEDMWHHVSCFATLRSELGYFESADKLPGFKALSKKGDQKTVTSELPAIKQEQAPEVKKVKTEDAVDGMSEDEKEMKRQNEVMFKYRDKLKDSLNKKELIFLLDANDQKIPTGEGTILDRLADIMTFGTLEPCTVCKGGQYVFNKIGYVCQGDLTESAKCKNLTKEPPRREFVVPQELAENYAFLKKYKYKPCTRIFKDVPHTLTSNVKKEKDDPDKEQPKIHREKPPLYEMEFVILGKPERGKDELKKQITKLGGKVTTKIQKSVMAVIASQAEVEKHGSRVQQAEDTNVHIVSEDFVDEAVKAAGKIPDLVIKKNICSWGADPNLRLPAETSSSSSKSKSRSIFTSSMPSKVKLKLKGGGAVDPDSGLEDVAHVYQSGSDKCTTALAGP